MKLFNTTIITLALFCSTPYAAAQESAFNIVDVPELRGPPTDALSSISPDNIVSGNDAQAEVLRDIISDPSTQHVRLFRIDVPAISQAEFGIVVPSERASDTRYTLTVDERRSESNSQVETILATGANDVPIELEMNRDGDDVAGTIYAGDDFYQIRTLGDGLNAVVKVDPTIFPQDDPPSVDGQRTEVPPADFDESLDVSSINITIMVAFTEQSAKRAGNMKLFAQTLSGELERTFHQSGLTQIRVNVAGVVNTGSTSSGSVETDLNNVRANSVSWSKAVHSYRNTYRADVVAYITESNDYCGMAQVGANAEGGYVAVNRGCAPGPNISFVHEFGHLVGASHNWSTGAKGFAYGYRDPAERFRTPMSYPCPTKPCRRLLVWSHPPKYGEEGRHDVRELMRRRIKAVSTWRN